MNHFRKIVMCCVVGVFLIISAGSFGWSAQSSQSKYVVVLDYTLRNVEDTADLETLRPGDKALVKVHLIDPRLSSGAYDHVRVLLDTPSFKTERKSTDINMSGDARAEKNGMGLTLIFPVQYTGSSDRFSFDYFYEGGAEGLEKDRVELTIAQCQPGVLPGEPGEDVGGGNEDDAKNPEDGLAEIEKPPGAGSEGESGNGNGAGSEGKPGNGNGTGDEDEFGNGNGAGSEGEPGNEDESANENAALPEDGLPGGGVGGASVGSGSAPQAAKEKVIRASQFAVSDVYYGDAPVVAGSDFDCTITVTATRGDENIKEARISLELPYGLSFVEESDRLYLGTLISGQSYTADFRLHADESIRNKVCSLTVKLSGVSSYYALPLEKEERVQINISPVERLEISNLQLPEKINAAYDDGSGYFQFMLTNRGYAPVTDVEITIEGDAFETGGPVIFEELKSSESQSVSLNLVSQEEGLLSGNIHISYINDFGEEKSLDEPIQVAAEYRKAEISHNIVIDPGSIQEVPLIPDWIWVVVSLGAVAGGVVIVRRIARAFRR